MKRPLLWVLSAYLLGVFFAWQSIFIGFMIGGIILWLAILSYLRVRKKGKENSSNYRFLWSLPLFLILGCFIMNDQIKLPKLYYAFEQETPCELTGQIKMIIKKQKGLALYVGNNQISLSEGKPYLCKNVIVYTSSEQNYRIGNQITVNGSLQKFKAASNPGQFNEKLYYQIEHIDFKLAAEQVAITDSEYLKYPQYLSDIKEQLIQVYQSILSDREAGTLIAMLLGEKYLLDDEVKQLYQQNGISHILAISGLHVSLIGMSFFWLLRKCKLSLPAATFITILFLYSYGVLTNFSVSTNRAIVMMVILLLAPLVGKTYDMLSATALSTFLILLQNPLQVISAGFLLSYLAVLGIALILPSLKILSPDKNIIRDNIFISCSATASTTPIILTFFYQYPLYGILTNLIILPFITILTLTSLLAGFFGLFHQKLGIFIIGGANYILKLYDLICRGINLLPYHQINVGKPSWVLVLISFLLMGSFLWVAWKYKKKSALILLLLSQLILFLPQHRAGLEVTLMDVGQGDGIYLESKEGTSFLVDGGSGNVGKVGRYRIVPFLKAKGVERLDYAIVTHLDQDHVSGLIEMIEEEQFTIGCLVLPYLRERDEKYIELEKLATDKNIKIQYITAGDRIQEGLLNIYCLHPTADFIGSTSNSYSTVLSINYGEFDMLLTGDLDGDGENLLMQELKENVFLDKWGISPAQDYEVLKVAHHGSKYSTSAELLKLLQPEIAFISCSEKNRYGHPHTELLNRLSKAESNTLITYQSGAITIRTDGKKLELEQYLK